MLAMILAVPILIAWTLAAPAVIGAIGKHLDHGLTSLRLVGFAWEPSPG
ncbi:hypothetical protein ABZX12_04320 [Kribbella sp. NPDC003505]